MADRGPEGVPEPVDHRPRRLRTLCRALACAVLLVFGAVALLLPLGENGVNAFGPVDQVAFFLIGVLIAGGVLVLSRFRVRADASGVVVRNALGERFFPWGVVVGVDVPRGSTWAVLELHDDETVPLLAIQTSDGDTAVDVVLALRRLRAAAQAG